METVKTSPLPETADRLWCTVTRKFNLGNYEMAEVQFGMAIDQKDEESFDQATKRLISNIQEGFLKAFENLVNEGD